MPAHRVGVGEFPAIDEVSRERDPQVGEGVEPKIGDSGGWGYASDPKSSCHGTVFVDCTHKDTKGKAWYSY